MIHQLGLGELYQPGANIGLNQVARLPCYGAKTMLLMVFYRLLQRRGGKDVRDWRNPGYVPVYSPFSPRETQSLETLISTTAGCKNINT
jgi:hypothetical protein